MPPGVFLNTFLGVDNEQRGLGAGCAADHVLQKLHVAGGIDDDVVAPGRFEETTRRIDGDPLRLLVLERVQQERVLERTGVFAAHGLYLVELALGQGAGVGHQTADDRALTVVHVAYDHDVHLLARLNFAVPVRLRCRCSHCLQSHLR